MTEKKQLRILFLDDNPERHETFRLRAKWSYPNASLSHTVRAEEAIQIMKGEERFDVLSLDLDLDITSRLREPKSVDPAEWWYYWREKDLEDGIAVARFIRDELPEDKLPSLVIVHSVNRNGAQRMVRTMKQRLHEVYQLPFDNSWSCLPR